MLHTVSQHFYNILKKAKLQDRKQFSSCQGLEMEGGVDYKEAGWNFWRDEIFPDFLLVMWLHTCSCLSKLSKLYTKMDKFYCM